MYPCLQASDENSRRSARPDPLPLIVGRIRKHFGIVGLTVFVLVDAESLTALRQTNRAENGGFITNRKLARKILQRFRYAAFRPKRYQITSRRDPQEFKFPPSFLVSQKRRGSKPQHITHL